MSTRWVYHRGKTRFARHVGGRGASAPLRSWQWRAPTVTGWRAAGRYYVASITLCPLLARFRRKSTGLPKELAAGQTVATFDGRYVNVLGLKKAFVNTVDFFICCPLHPFALLGSVMVPGDWACFSQRNDTALFWAPAARSSPLLLFRGQRSVRASG